MYGVVQRGHGILQAEPLVFSPVVELHETKTENDEKLAILCVAVVGGGLAEEQFNLRSLRMSRSRVDAHIPSHQKAKSPRPL
jgi:hypothetical protein